MAAPIVYRSSDASAPVLTGAVGSLVALLDACLVNGYGAKAAAGWTKPFSAANRGAYRWPGGTHLYWDVDDAGGGTGGAKEARTSMYDTMSAVGAGTSKTPSAVNWLVVRKSATADATARPWVIIADDRTVYVLIKAGDDTSYYGTHVGDFIPLAGSDPWRAACFGRSSENSPSNLSELFSSQSQAGVATGSHFFIKTLAGGAAPSAGKAGDMARSNSPSVLNGAIPYPNPYDLQAYIAPILLHETAGGIRGRVRGMWHWLHTGGLADGDTFTATGACYAGRSFLAVAPLGGGQTSVGLFETTAWDT